MQDSQFRLHGFQLMFARKHKSFSLKRFQSAPKKAVALQRPRRFPSRCLLCKLSSNGSEASSAIYSTDPNRTRGRQSSDRASFTPLKHQHGTLSPLHSPVDNMNATGVANRLRRKTRRRSGDLRRVEPRQRAQLGLHPEVDIALAGGEGAAAPCEENVRPPRSR